MLKLQASKTETGIKNAVNSTMTRLMPSKPNKILQFSKFSQFISSMNWKVVWQVSKGTAKNMV